MSTVDVVDGQDELCADAGRRLQHRVLFVVHESGEVAAFELCALYDFRRCSEAAQSQQRRVGICWVGVSEVDVHGAYLDVEHGAGAADGAEEEARAYVADEGVRVAEELWIGIICLHDFLANLAGEHDTHVAGVAFAAALSVAEDVVGGGEDFRCHGASLCFGILPQVGVGVEAFRFLEQLVVVHAQGPDFQLHGVVLVAESVFDEIFDGSRNIESLVISQLKEQNISITDSAKKDMSNKIRRILQEIRGRCYDYYNFKDLY